MTNSGSWSMAPYLRVKGAADAIEWYVNALGAVETERYAMPTGSIGHAELNVNGNRLCLADAPVNAAAPQSYNDVPILLFATVPDVDAAYHRAIEAGAQPEREPADQVYGERTAGFIDPFGHVWYLATPLSR